MEIIAWLFLFVAGWLIGTGVNIISDQFPADRRLSHPVCDHCGDKRGWLAYLFLEDCQTCGERRSLRSHVVVWLLAGCFAAVNIWSPDRLLAIEALILLVFFCIVFVIDVEHRLILHPVSVAGIVLAIPIGTRMHGPGATLLGGAAGFGLMFCLYLLGELFSRYLAKRRGEPIEEVALGFGDVNLSGVLGLLLGWPGIAAGLVLAIVAGGFVSGIYLLTMLLRKRYRAFTALPYAPFLIVAAAGLLFRP